MIKKDFIIIIGAFGSGKSEYAINLAKMLKKPDENVSLVDLDVVNPYFRSRDVRNIFQKEGIEVIAPESGYGFADLPMISPRVQGVIQDYDRVVILDVGGDPSGCKVLRRFEDSINERGYQMRLVINTWRPFTSNINEIKEMKSDLEKISRLKVTELVCNANLMELTSVDLIRDAISILKKISIEESLIFRNFLVLNDKLKVYPDEIDEIKKIDLSYYLKKPWEKD